MIQSMTGYGTAEHVEDGYAFTAELRSVNHRYLKLTYKLPEAWQFAERDIEAVLRGRLNRGSVTCVLRVHSQIDNGPGRLNPVVLQQYVEQLLAVSVPEGVRTTIDLASLAQLPGVTQAEDIPQAERDHKIAILRELFSHATDSLSAMRCKEGAALSEALNGFCQDVRDRVSIVAERAPCVVDEYHARLQTRVEQLLAGGKFELQADGLAREVAIYAERCDIGEELTRLDSHLEQFSNLCQKKEPVGRTMDFLTQELLREANTIASKSNDATISRTIVEVKGLIDRLKEQVQNVE